MEELASFFSLSEALPVLRHSGQLLLFTNRSELAIFDSDVNMTEKIPLDREVISATINEGGPQGVKIRYVDTEGTLFQLNIGRFVLYNQIPEQIQVVPLQFKVKQVSGPLLLTDEGLLYAYEAGHVRGREYTGKYHTTLVTLPFKLKKLQYPVLISEDDRAYRMDSPIDNNPLLCPLEHIASVSLSGPEVLLSLSGELYFGFDQPELYSLPFKVSYISREDEGLEMVSEDGGLYQFTFEYQGEEYDWKDDCRACNMYHGPQGPDNHLCTYCNNPFKAEFATYEYIDLPFDILNATVSNTGFVVTDAEWERYHVTFANEDLYIDNI